MKITRIDPARCNGCQNCLEDCPTRLFRVVQHTGKVQFHGPAEHCIACGHCVAVCPTEAVIYDFESDRKSIPRPAAMPFGGLLSFMATQRSVRRYKQQPVAHEDIAAVFEAARYAPSAGNKRSWGFAVVTDAEMIHALAQQVVRFFSLVRALATVKWLLRIVLPGKLKENFTGTKPEYGIDLVTKDFERGRDRVLFNAPCLIVLHAPSYAHLSGVDAGIAIDRIMLAAHAHGLGTCCVGFLSELTFIRPSLRRWLGVPTGERVWGAFTLGYPDVTYLRVPPREELQINWLTEE